MYYVYILRSRKYVERIYAGFTDDLRKRLKEHNLGLSVHTSKYVPWEVEFYVGFKSKKKAIDFEQYLKTGSGQAFARKRFIEL